MHSYVVAIYCFQCFDNQFFHAPSWKIFHDDLHMAGKFISWYIALNRVFRLFVVFGNCINAPKIMMALVQKIANFGLLFSFINVLRIFYLYFHSLIMNIMILSNICCKQQLLQSWTSNKLSGYIETTGRAIHVSHGDIYGVVWLVV